MGVGKAETSRLVLVEVYIGNVAVGLLRKPKDLDLLRGSPSWLHHTCLLPAWQCNRDPHSTFAVPRVWAYPGPLSIHDHHERAPGPTSARNCRTRWTYGSGASAWGGTSPHWALGMSRCTSAATRRGWISLLPGMTRVGVRIPLSPSTVIPRVGKGPSKRA